MSADAQDTTLHSDNNPARGGRRYILDLLKAAGRDQALATPLVFIEILDGDRAAADILNQILFYRDVFKPADGWVYITAEKWKADAGLTHFQLERAFKGDKRARQRRYRRTLVDAGARREKRYRNGSNTWYYTVDDARLLEVISAHLANVELQHVEVEDVQVQHAEPEHVETDPNDGASFSQLKHVEVQHVELEHVEVEHVELQESRSSNFNNVQLRTSTLPAANKTPESTEESLKDSSEIDSGEVAERAGAREEPPPPPSEFHPIFQAFLEATPEARRALAYPPTPEVAEIWDGMARELADRHGLTPDEARELVRDKWLNPARTSYRFDWIKADLKRWRDAQLEQAARDTPALRLVDPAPAPDDADRFRAAADQFNDNVPDWMRAAPGPLSDPTTPEVEPSAAIPGAALDAWQMVHEQLRQQWDAPTFDRLLRDAYLARVEADPGGDVFLIVVPSAHVRDGLRPQTRAALCKLLATAYGGRVQLDVAVGQPPAGEAPKPISDLLRERWLQRVERADPAGVGK